nr:MAG TPA: hypothetical protein [Caudoviricetes sp.]
MCRCCHFALSENVVILKVMATVDWKKLEGRIFRFDVNTSTEDALKATNPAIIHFTTEGDIVMNGEKFCSPKKKDLKVVKLYTSYKYAKYDAVLSQINGEELQYLNYPEEATEEDNYKSYMIVASLIDGKPFYWFGNAYNYGGILERIASESIIGVDEKTFNAGFDSLANDIVFAFDYDSIEVKSFTDGSGGSDYGDLTIVGLFSLVPLCIKTVADNEAGGINFEVYPGSELKSVYSDISLLPLVTGGLTCTASKEATGAVKIGKGLTSHSDKSDKGDYIDDESVGLLELLPAKADTLGGVKKANLNLQSEYEFLKAVPSVTTLDEAKFAINHLRIICKTLVDKLEEAGMLNK